MTDANDTIKPASVGFASLRNLVLMDELILALTRRPPHLPGIGVVHGPSGYGKTYACAWAAAQSRACYVECGTYATARTLLAQILKELGVVARRSHTIDDMIGLAAAELRASGRPLIIDEADRLYARNLVELIREVHDQARHRAVVILVGEEELPHKLRTLERVHNRVLHWSAAQGCDLADARQLATLYAPRVTIADDLLDHLVQATGGSTRRICVNIERMAEFARGEGCRELDRARWGDQPLYTGAPPAPRRFVG